LRAYILRHRKPHPGRRGRQIIIIMPAPMDGAHPSQTPPAPLRWRPGWVFVHQMERAIKADRGAQ
jgi:hypothetical protein